MEGGDGSEIRRRAVKVGSEGGGRREEKNEQ